MSKEPLPCERGRLSYVIVLFGLTHRALRKEKILDEGTKLFDAPLFMRNNRSQCGANMTNINMEQAPVGTMGTLLLQPGHLSNQQSTSLWTKNQCAIVLQPYFLTGDIIPHTNESKIVLPPFLQVPCSHFEESARLRAEGRTLMRT